MKTGIFLSWGSVGVEAYSMYKPDLALKYAENVLSRYEKDGLAYQRYGRINQEGLGDHILSGNSLALVGLYKAIYGINPLRNRLYLNPHLPEKLSGTELIYNFRNEKLKIGLAVGNYSVSYKQFKVSSKSDFSFYSGENEMAYFNGRDDQYSLKVRTAGNVSLEIIKWDAGELQRIQNSGDEKGKISYTIRVSEGRSFYTVNTGIRAQNVKSDNDCFLRFEVKPGVKPVMIKIIKSQSTKVL
jgi:hypothetical protein